MNVFENQPGMSVSVRHRFLLTAAGIIFTFLSFAQNDSVTWHASDRYKNPSFLTKIFLGTNYRKEWETPVKLPVFRMNELGLKIKELGGGQQTISLQMADQNGHDWSLRSIDKNVSKALPKRLQKSFILYLTQQIISAAHPYVPLTIPVLADTLGVVAARPVIYYVPDDPAFGQYRSLFANTLALLEEREPTPDHSDTKGTDKLLDKIFEDNDEQVDQEAVLKARVLDMLIGDWDRHSDQWRWAEKKKDGQKYFYPIPRDRDQAYFYSNGILVRAMQLLVLKHLVSYNDDLEKINSFNYKSWPFDKLFLNGLDKQQWTGMLRSVQAGLTDDVIHESIKKLPPEIYPIHGRDLERKLRGRRNKLLKKGLKYYRFLATDVTVYGSDKPEYFYVTGDNKTTLVSVYENKKGKQGRRLYERRFVKGDTHSITLKGLKGDDHFFVDDKTNRIKLKIEGEDGADTYEVKDGKKVEIIDSNTDTRKITNKGRARVKNN
jgi:hypothetical protein